MKMDSMLDLKIDLKGCVDIGKNANDESKERCVDIGKNTNEESKERV